MKSYKVFAINPGSTSTKIAMFEGDKEVFSKNVSHDAEKLKEFKEISDQFDYRKETILKELAEAGLAVVITTQCMYEGVDLSVYEVGQNMKASNVILGGTMTTEALTMKLMWALAHFEDLEKVKEFME